MNPLRRYVVAGLALLLLVSGSGCSTFRRDAKAARVSHPPVGTIEGLWVGQWHSDAKPSHGGELQMVLTRRGDNLYRAASRSRWWRVFRSSYDVEVVVTPVRPGEYLVQGGRNIWPFGNYSLSGRIESEQWKAKYRIGSESGTIDLKRPPAPAASQ